MKNVLLQRAIKLNRNSKNRRRWQNIVRTMAMVVVFCTTYALILPAITMEGNLVCGLDEHVHSEACYGQVPVVKLQCSLDENAVVVHSHDGSCYDAQNVLACTLPARTLHSHDESCVTRAEVPSCAFIHVHSEECTGIQEVLTCTVEETEGHAHSESCTVTGSALVCGLEEGGEHAHEDACYEQTSVPCEIPESQAHAHTEECYAQQEKTCELTTNDGHIHEDGCYESSMHCTLEELELHTHEEACYGTDGGLVCEKQVVIAHQHTESCCVETEQVQQVLICGKEEHTHIETCYPEEEENARTEHLCGMGVHAHVESCFDETGALVCTIPEHAHEAACLVAGLDLTADVESSAAWEAAAMGTALTGNWGEDVLAVAKTQLGYEESKLNVVLEGEELKGYTHFGAKYGRPYEDWNAIFVAFCLDYAGVKDFPLRADSAQWALLLRAQQLFVSADAFVPEAGDLFFFDLDHNGEADYMGIAAEQVSGTDTWKIIAGDDQSGCVKYETWQLSNGDLLGGCPLPENPMPGEELDQAAAVAAMIQTLPTADAAQAELLARNEVLDKAAYDTYLDDLKNRVAAAKDAYSALDDDQKALAGDVAVLDELEKLCAQIVWQQLPILTQDGALVNVLNAVPAAAETIENQQTVQLAFQVEMQSYTEEIYSEGRVKLEFVLPLTQEQAVFDLAAMPWLEDAVLTTETRTIGETETECQVLTGYRHVKASTMNGSIVPGSFTESAAVKVLDMEHNSRISIQISAAMEHNTWEGVCQTHQAAEKLTIESQTITVLAPASAEEQQAEYEALLAEYEELIAQELPEEELTAAAEALWEKISGKYLGGWLAEEAFADLSQKTGDLKYGDLNSVAEPSIGNNWQILRDSGWFEEFSNAVATYAANNLFTVRSSALAPVVYGAAQPSDVQIREEGGEEISSEGAVYVSKTIAGTDTENVFDITLDIITQDIVTEVYKEPDMAVVIVMDISNTMATNFGGTTRYKAAMTAAENFLDQFAANNLGASNVGFVAFNTDAHQIFPMSPCSTTAQATALKNTMRTQTGNIINASGYADSHKRFTNIEAGLKRAYDLLNTVDNEHKYIVFLSDGFPTTYIESGYVGYDTYDSDGTRFYDSVELYNDKKRPCSYGTSYSDEAAIRARKMATTLKNNGATIFSIGVDIGSQTIKYYVDAFAGRSFTVVDRRNTNYEIGSASDANAFKNWLGYSIGSGEGYYYDSTNSSGLNNAFNSIFEKIKELNAQSSHLDWVATDPMPGMGVHELEAVEFIGFYNKDGVLVDGDLTGISGDGWNYENTASFNTKTSTISWDLKNSRYISTVVGNTTNYECSLTYRVRLKNEKSDFIEYASYDTNDVTSLTYRIIDKTGDRVTVSEQRSVNFPIPAVEGYLGEFSFDKQDSYGRPVAGAEFTLSHDTAHCGYCRGDGKGHVPLNNMVAESDADGKVSFTNIPSGHTYTLTETKIPDGYQANGNAYSVTVAYDTLTVNVTDKDGNELTWEQLIENYTAYRLPETGGSGTSLFTFGGLLMITAACVYFVIQIERKYRRGGAYRKS